MATAYLYPAGDDTTDWANSTGANHYTEVDDPQGSPDDDTTKVDTGGNHNRQTFSLRMFNGASESYSGNNSLTGGWTDYSYQFNDVPGGTGWTVQNLKDIVFGFMCRDTEFPATDKYELFSTDDSDIDSKLSGATINHVTIYARAKYTGSAFNATVHCTQVYLSVDYTAGGPTVDQVRVHNDIIFEVSSVERIAHRLINEATSAERIAHYTDLAAPVIPPAVFVPDTDNGTDSSGTWLRNGGSSSDLHLAIDDRLPLDYTDYVYIDSTGVTLNTSQFVTKNTGAATAGDNQPSYQKLRMYIRDMSDSTSLTYTLTPILVKNGTTYLHPSTTFVNNLGQSYQLSRMVEWESPPWGGAWGAIQDISFGVRVTAMSGSGAGREIRIIHMFLETYGVDGLNLVFKPGPWGSGSSTWIPSSGNSTFNALGLHIQDDDANYVENVTPATGEYLRASTLLGDDDLHPLGTAGYGLRMDVILEQDTTSDLVLKGQLRQDITYHDSANQVTVNTTGKQTISFYWYDAPESNNWDDVPSTMQLELEVVTGNSGTLKVYQMKATFFRFTDIERIVNDTVLELSSSSRSAHDVSFAPYDPQWWNTDFNKRALIDFGTNHDAYPSGFTHDLEVYTGFEERIGSNGVVNESIGHASRQIAYHNDGGANEYIIATWLAQDPGVTNFRVYAVKKDLKTGVTGSPVLVHTTGTSSDTHYIPSILIDSNGYIHLFYGAHTSPLKYKRSTNPHDLSTWTAEVDLASGTYPRPIQLSNGDIYVFMRGAFTRLWGWIKSTNGGVSWSSFWSVVNYTDSILTGIPHPTSVYCGGVAQNASDRVFVCLTFWDSYGNENKGRTITVMYSDDMADWYDMDGNLIKSTDGSGANAIIHGDIPANHRVFESGAPFPTTGPFYHTNTEALVLDTNGWPHFVCQSWITYIREQCPIYHAKWNGSSWVTTELSALVGAEEMYYYRAGGQIYSDNNEIHIYMFARPQTEEGSAELYKYISFDNGSTWSYSFMTKNTQYGIGMMSVLDKVYSNVNRWLIYSRGLDILLSPDNIYAFARSDGEDIRVIRQQHFNGGSTVDTELDRLPDRFQAEDTILRFKNPIAIGANLPHAHTYDKLWLYYGNSVATGALADGDNVYDFLEGFEVYVAGSQLHGQNGWSSASPTRFTIFQYDQSQETHPNKLYSGIRSLNLVEAGSDAYIERAFAATHDSHDIFAWLWNEQSANEVYVELYDSSSGNYVSVGFSTDCTWRKTGLGWTSLTTAASKQYHQVQFRVTSSGVTIFVDGVEQVTNDTVITQATHIRIGVLTDGQGYCDAIYSRKYTSNGPDPILGTPEGDADVFWYRGAHRAVLSYLRNERIAEDLELAQKANIRSAGDVTLEIQEAYRQANDLVLELLEKSRTSNKLLGDKTTIERVASKAVLEEQLVERLAHALVNNKVFTDRIRQQSTLEATDGARIRHAITGNKYSTDREVHDVLGSKHLLVRIAHDMGLEHGGIIRVMQTFVGDKYFTVRMIQQAILEAGLQERIAQLTLLEAAESARQANVFVPDKSELSRIAADIVLEELLYVLIANGLILQGMSQERIASLLELQSVDRVLMAHGLVGQKQLSERIRHQMNFGAKEGVRIHQAVFGDKTSLLRIPGMADLEEFEDVRVAMTIIADQILTRRAANTLRFEAGETLRLPNTLTLITTVYLRFANLASLQLADVVEIANRLNLEAIGHDRIANESIFVEVLQHRIRHDLLMEYADAVRAVNDLELENRDIARAPNLVALIITSALRIRHDSDNLKHQVERVSNLLVAWKFDSVRLASLLLFIPPTQGVCITKEDLEGITITNQALKAIGITNEDLLSIHIINEGLTGATIDNENIKGIIITNERIHCNKES